MDKKVIDLLAAEAAATDDPLAAVDSIRDAIREDVLRIALERANWSMNGAARLLRRSPGTIDFIVKRMPTLATEYAQKKSA